MSRSRVLLLAAAAALGACAAAPLGDDFDALPPAARDQRALEALERLFAERVDGVGRPLPDREVLLVDLQGISYEGDGGTSHLRWLDIEAVEQDDLPELPARPVNLRLYLRRGSRSEEAVQDLVTPTLAGTGLFRRYVLLRMRPGGSRARFVMALDHVRARTQPVVVAARGPRSTAPDAAPVSTASAAPSSTAAVTSPRAPAARLDEVEATLRRLKQWREEGLIDQAEYEAKRKALLEGL